MLIYIIINLLLSSFSVIPLWNLKKSSLDLLKENNNYTYTISHGFMYEMEALLSKEIKRTNDGTIIHENLLYIDSYLKGRVDFENIDSFYKLANRKIICPFGKYNPINIDTMSEFENVYQNSDDWNLKCYKHNTGHFFIYYLNNKENQVYELDTNNNNYIHQDLIELNNELYDYKLVNRDYDYQTTEPYYPFCALTIFEDHIALRRILYELRNNYYIGDYIRGEEDYEPKKLTEAKKYSKGNFDYYSNNFFYFTYNNISDFSSGFSIKTIEYPQYYIGNVEVANNYI